MNLLTTLTLLGFSSEALAGSPYYQSISFSKTFSDWKLADKMGSVKQITMEGTVDVPLYTSTAGQPKLLTYVGTSADDPGELFYLDPISSMIVVTEGYAKDNDLEIKVTNKRLIPVPEDFKAGGEIKYVQIPELHVGGVVLKQVTAFISGSETKNLDALGNLNYKKPSIGLGALDISYAILESEGVLRITETNKGPELMQQSGGTVVPYQEMDWSIGTVGPWSLSGQSKVIIPGLSLIIPVSFDDKTEITALLNFRSSISSLDSYYPVEGTLPYYSFDIRNDWLTPTVAGTKLESNYIARPVMTDMDEDFVPMAVLGSNTLSNYDIVVDKSTKTLSFAPTNSRKRLSSLQEELKRAKEALADKPEEASEETEEKTEESTEESGLNVGGTKKLIGLLEKDNQLEATLEYYDALIEDADEKTDCALWLDYGDVQRKLGNIENALTAYQESSRLFHSWWDIELHSRMDINKAQDKMKDKESDAAKEKSKGQPINSVEDGWYISQPDHCYVADGYVAYSQMLLSQYDQVQELYRSNLDLDGNLARALGNTAFLINDTQLAHEAYRQAIRLEDGQSDRRTNRLGLALIYADQGKWEQANALFQEAMFLEGKKHSITEQIWMDNARHFIGPEEAIKMLNQWLVTHPLDGSAHITLLREYTLQMNALQTELRSLQEQSTEDTEDPEMPAEAEEKSNDIAGQLQALEEAKSMAVSAATTFFNNVDPWDNDHNLSLIALRIQFFAYSGDLEAAEKLLKSTGERYHSDLEIAAATLYSLQGKPDDAQAALENAARYNPSHPGYSLLLK